MTRGRHRLRWLAAPCLLLSGLASAQDPGVLQRTFSAEATIHADGSTDVGEISRLDGRLGEWVHAETSRMRFIPAQRSGVAVATRVELSGIVTLTPTDDGDFAVEIRDVNLMPLASRALRLVPPLYPPQHMRSGTAGIVELLLRVGPDGRVREAVTILGTAPALERAAREAARRWRFTPTGEAAEFSVPFLFYTNLQSVAELLPRLRCAVSPSNAHVAGQSGCVDRIEVVAGPVRRVDVLLP